jgi:hypothetical protein
MSLELFVLSMARHQNVDLITIAGCKSKWNNGSFLQDLAGGLAKKYPTRLLNGSKLKNTHYAGGLTEVSFL